MSQKKTSEAATSDTKAPEDVEDSAAFSSGAKQNTTEKRKKKKKKKKEDKWENSDAKKILKRALAKGEDEMGNKVLLDSKMGESQFPRHIFKLFKDRKEFQQSDFNDPKLFADRLRRLRQKVIDGKLEASRDRIALESSLADHPIPDKEQFVDVALPSLRVDMDAGKHLTMKPRQLRNTRPEYMKFALDKFRKHIHQEVYTRKACVQYKWKHKYGIEIGQEPKPEVFDCDYGDFDEEENEKEEEE